MDWGQIALIVLPVVISVAFFLLKGKAEKILKALDELGDVLEALPRVLADQKLTDEERAELVKEAKEALAAFKAILQK